MSEYVREAVTDIRELQFRLIFAMLVAGKTAAFARGKVRSLFPVAGAWPFDAISRWAELGTLRSVLEKHKVGSYTKLEKGFQQLVEADLDLTSCSPEELESIHGIGPKTSRFFILWTRVGAPYAALDVHVLRWLRGLGHKAPKQTPSGQRYRKLEKVFLDEARARNMHPGDLDAMIWSQATGVD